jgi:6-phosphogluconolactonase (cycloisomerase 2 family)
MLPLRHSLALALALIVSAAFAGPTLAAGPAGSLSQPAGGAGCTTEDGKSNAVDAQCADGRGLFGAEALTLSPDGKFAYTYSYETGAIAILSRDPATGVLTQADDAGACVARSTLSGDCTAGRLPSANSDSAHALAITPDGAFLFAAGSAGAIVSVFARNASTGALTEIAGVDGCVSTDGNDANSGVGSCSVFAPLDATQALALSPDGKFLYVGGDSDTTGLTIFSVGATGTLTPLADPNGCVTPIATAGCSEERYGKSFYDIALSPDGRTLYAIDDADDVVDAFTRDAGTGVVTQPDSLGYCVYNGGVGTEDPCMVGHGMKGVQSVEVSPDGKLVIVGTYDDTTDGLAVLHRAATGELSQSDGAAGCLNVHSSDGCGASRQTADVYRTLFTPDSKTLFVAGYSLGSPDASGIAVFDVAADGTLAQRAGALGCYSDSGKDSTGASGGCTAARGVKGPVGLVLSADGKWLYESAYGDNGVATFRLEFAPTCTDASASTAFGTAVTVPVACTDPNGDAVTLAGVDGPGHGSVTFSGLSATYTPAAGFSGDDTFRVKGNDGGSDSAPATVTVHVGAGPPPPVVIAKKAPQKVSLTAKPKRDRTLPFKFTFSGKLTPAVGTTCSGKVVVTVKRGKKTVAKKTATVASTCKWKAVVKFKNRKKLGKKRSGSLTAKARYGGNAAMTAKSSKTVKVRFG